MEELTIIGDWYRERKLGTGGFGSVTLWRNRKTENRVAIKKCHQIPPNEFTEKQKERWNRELEYMMNEINNENIVKGLTIEPQSFLVEMNKTSPTGMPVLVMEYCEEGDLRRLLCANNNINGLAESEVRNVLQSLKNAISYLHNLKITHRDLKPENIVIKMDENNRRIYKLTDLGYAKGLDYDSLKASRVGTFEYVAPELMISEKYNCTVDYWSFGTIAFEIITGIRPFVPHLPLAQWIITVKRKKSEHICITEDATGFLYDNHIFNENHISSVFAKYIEEWLRLSLEWNYKQRGHVFEMPSNPKQKSVSFASDADATSTESPALASPVLTLKIFSMLDEILKKKILTMFSLETGQYLSYEIDETSTIDWLIENVAKDLNMHKDKIRFTLNLNNENYDIESNAKPIDLYMDNYYDDPMVFITKSDINVNVNDFQRIEPISVCNLFNNPDQELKSFLFKRFAYNSYYFIQNEQKRFINYIRGFRAYVLNVNHKLNVNEADVRRMTRLVYSLDGSLKLYESTLCETQRELGTEWPDVLKPIWMEQYKKLSENIVKMMSACEKIQQRYRSALRRSNDANRFTEMACKEEDYFEVKKLDNAFEGIRGRLAQKLRVDNREIIDLNYQCRKRRDQLLQDKEFITCRVTVQRVDIEREEIIKAIDMAIAQAEKYKEEIYAANSSLQKAIRCIVKTKLPKEFDFLPDIEMILNVVGKKSRQQSVDFEIGGIVSSDVTEKGNNEMMCFGEDDDTASLIEANEKLRMTMDGLINDIHQEIAENAINIDDK